MLAAPNVKWALSNNLKTNLTLKDWAENHDYKIHYLNTTYGNCNYQKKDRAKDIEVLITNYKENVMSNTNNSKGIGFVGLLTITFIVLRLINVITWSWVWVLSPLWIYAIVKVILIVILTIIMLNENGVSCRKRKKKH